MSPLQAELQTVQSDLLKKTESHESVESTLEAAQGTIYELQEAQKTLEATVADLETQLTASKSETSGKTEEIDGLQKRLDKAQREASEGRDVIAQKENELVELQAQIEAAKLENESLTTHAAEQAAQAEAVQAEMASQVSCYMLFSLICAP